MPRLGLSPEDPFIRLRSAFRVDGMMHTGLVRAVFSRLERVRPRKAHQFPLHQHREFEIILVVRGPYFYRHNGESFRLPRDTVLVLEPGDWHEDHCRAPLDYAAILFTLHSRGDGQHLPGLRFFREGAPLSRRLPSESEPPNWGANSPFPQKNTKTRLQAGDHLVQPFHPRFIANE